MRILQLTVPASDGAPPGIWPPIPVPATGGDDVELVLDLSLPRAADALTIAFADLASRLSIAPRPPIFVRIPALADPACSAVLDRAVAVGVDGILLPASLGGHDVTLLDARISVAEAVHGTAEGATRIIAEATDCARAVFGLASYRGASHRLAGLVLDMAALARDLGGLSLTDAAGMLRAPIAQARGLLLLAAAASGVAALQRVAAGDDREGAAALAEADGFAGLLVDAAR